MKTKITFLFFCAGLYLNAQQIPNSSFDSVYFGGIDRVFNWITSDGIMMAGGTLQDVVYPLNANQHFQAMGLQYQEILWMGQRIDTTHLSQACMLLTSHPKKKQIDSSYFESFVLNGLHFYTDSIGYIDFQRSGSPFSHKPAKLKGWYRFHDSVTPGFNWGKVLVMLKKWNASTQQSDLVAMIFSTQDLGETTGWQQFELPFTYSTGQQPDSIIVAFFANSNPHQKSSFWLDELSFDYSTFDLVEYQDPSIHIYPNPVVETIHVEFAEAYDEYQLLNARMQVVQCGRLNKQLSVSKSPTPFWILQLTGKQGKQAFFKLLNAQK